MLTAAVLLGGLLSVRPEVIRFDAPPVGMPNVLAGTVHDSVYLGEVAQHQVRIAAREGGAEASWKALWSKIQPISKLFFIGGRFQK